MGSQSPSGSEARSTSDKAVSFKLEERLAVAVPKAFKLKTGRHNTFPGHKLFMRFSVALGKT